MKKNKIIYWTATGIISFVMLFSIYKMYSPDYAPLGFPVYFRTELVVAKLLGLVVLLLPQFPLRMKEWAYAGFGIVLISACVAKANSGYPFIQALEPVVFLTVLIVSYIYLHRLHKSAVIIA